VNESDQVQVSNGIYQSKLSEKSAPPSDTILGIRFLRSQLFEIENDKIEAIDCIYEITQVYLNPIADTTRKFSILKGKHRILGDSILFLWDSLGHVYDVR
jgi:hypothetical protein